MKNQFIIEWNAEKCLRPHDCGKCLEICPEAVFALYAPNRQEGIEPDDYVISPAMQYFCTGCGSCLEVCPKDALKILPRKQAQ